VKTFGALHLLSIRASIDRPRGFRGEDNFFFQEEARNYLPFTELDRELQPNITRNHLAERVRSRGSGPPPAPPSVRNTGEPARRNVHESAPCASGAEAGRRNLEGVAHAHSHAFSIRGLFDSSTGEDRGQSGVLAPTKTQEGAAARGEEERGGG